MARTLGQSLLLLARRWRLPAGTATVIHLAQAGLSGAITGFANLSTVAGFVIAGVCVDALAGWLRPAAGRRVAYWAFAGLAPVVTWALYFGVAATAAGRLPTVVELWTGAPVVAGLVGLLLAALLAPAPVPGHRPTG